MISSFIIMMMLLLPPAQEKTVTRDCRCNGFKLYGKVKIVTDFPDLKVKIVENFPDLKVQEIGRAHV